MPQFVYLDLETTGLDPDLHEAWEIAYAVDDGPIRVHQLAHSLTTADPEALRINRYRDRAQAIPTEGDLLDVQLREILAGTTIVGANPAFDTAFLRARWGVAPWHHRLLDVETFAMGALGLDTPQSLSRTAEMLRERGYPVGVNDHTAEQDVRVTRDVHHALVDVYRNVGWAA